jgi:hypothetical protein
VFSVSTANSMQGQQNNKFLFTLPTSRVHF